MKKVATFIKKYWKNFDDTLINPPKQTTKSKNYKGHNIYKTNKFSEGGPAPTPEQILNRHKFMQQQQIKMQPRDIRIKCISYGMAFVVWYLFVTLFIMYRMKGDDLDLLQKQAKHRQVRKQQLAAQKSIEPIPKSQRH